MSGVNARDDGDLRKYRTEIPNLVLDLGLDPFALALYTHLKRTAGAGPEGRCYKSTRTLARETGMSIGKVAQARQDLERPRPELDDKALIVVTRHKDQSRAAEVVVRDVWVQNFATFAERSRERARLRERSSDERSVHDMNTERSSDERKKEPEKKEPYKNALYSAKRARDEGGVRIEGWEASDVPAILEADPLGDRIWDLILLRADENKTKRMKVGAARNEFVTSLAELRERFSDEVIREAMDQAIRKPAPSIKWIEQACSNISNDRGQQRSAAASKISQRARERANDTNGTPPEIIDRIFELCTPDGVVARRERGLRRIMQRFDFTSGEDPPFPIQKELGGTDNERWQMMDSIDSLARRARSGAFA